MSAFFICKRKRFAVVLIKKMNFLVYDSGMTEFLTCLT